MKSRAVRQSIFQNFCSLTTNEPILKNQPNTSCGFVDLPTAKPQDLRETEADLIAVI